jgi:hypothetical protein
MQYSKLEGIKKNKKFDYSMIENDLKPSWIDRVLLLLYHSLFLNAIVLQSERQREM